MELSTVFFTLQIYNYCGLCNKKKLTIIVAPVRCASTFVLIINRKYLRSSVVQIFVTRDLTGIFQKLLTSLKKIL